MVSTLNIKEIEFTEAANNWNLEKLYIDLASAKGKGLTPVEKRLLRGLLCGYSPSEIADQLYQSRNSSTVRVYLSNGLYKYIQELMIRQTGELIKIKNWSRVSNLLERRGYKIINSPQSLRSDSLEIDDSEVLYSSSKIATIDFKPINRKYQDWEEIIDVKLFYGRTEELIYLQNLIIKENCRLLAILGVGGIGKTTLAVRCTQEIQSEFQFLLWRSLRHAPLLSELLANLIRFLSGGKETNLPSSPEEKIALLMTYLRSHRCLLILDHSSAILQSGNIAGYYREGYEDYGELFLRLGQESHRSCLILTSREKPKEIAFMEGENLPVRCLEITGLKTTAAQELLSAKGVIGSQEDSRLLLKRYGGNPLVTKIVATTIKDVFDGDITEFLAQGILVFGDICELLDQQFNRLSDVEKKVMYWLAIHHKLVPLRGLREEMVLGVSKREHLEAFESLRRRSLIAKNSTSWTLPPVFKVYVTEKLAQQVFQEMSSKEVAMLLKRGIINSQIKNPTSSLTTDSVAQTSDKIEDIRANS